MKDRVVSKKEVSESDINGTYEEIFLNWRNRLE
ncbi:MAG: hypothetical protein K0S61_2826 [Anaerocolumna sp.]|jgi:hypothetical protein|nr:hypothetical protein [Anaerocolumna sp.]